MKVGVVFTVCVRARVHVKVGHCSMVHTLAFVDKECQVTCILLMLEKP